MKERGEEKSLPLRQREGDALGMQPVPQCPDSLWRSVRAADHQCSLQLGQEGKVPLQSAHMYYNVTEKVRRVMESYFRLDTPLYFSYSHLVCRTAIEGRPRHPCSFSRVGCALSLHGTLRTWRRRGCGPFTLAEKPGSSMEKDPVN